ncbi:MAG: SDR family NAD(P)-dependent oxidoreductase [Campylobacterales bacterium]|nr:SDR family NAD(P)-dependent oxidoreductase [Campylobacterales bacterium]
MKYFVVVGGSKGIGREFIKQVIKKKTNRVLLLSRTNIDIKSENIVHFQTDLLSNEAIQTTINSIKKLDHKIDSLLFCQKYRPIDTKKRSLSDELMVSVESTKMIIEALRDSFSKKGLKSIVLVGSIASKFVATEQAVDYHIAKSALVGLMHYYAVSLANKGMRVNMVSPSTTLKDENRDFYKKNHELYDLYKSVSPQKKLLKSKNVTDLIRYLLSRKSKFVTGQNILIDGGLSLLWQEAVARNFKNIGNIKLTQ